MSQEVDDIVAAVERLTVLQLAELRDRLLGEDGPDIAVREPARPKPPAPREGRA